MPLTLATISGTFVRPDLGSGAMTVYIEAATVGSRLTYSGNVIAGKYGVRIASDGTASVTIPVLPQGGVLPSDARWRLVMLSSRDVYIKEFTLSGDTTWGALVDVSSAPVTSSILTQAIAAQNAAIAAAASVTPYGISVVTYGAVGNGVTDDTAAIHAARDAAAVIGADVFFPSGKTYMVNQLTANAANQTWWFAGATIKGLASSTSFMLKVTGADVTLHGGTLDGSAVANPAMDNPFQSTADGTIWENITVKSSPGYGIKSVDVGRQTVRNCRLLNSSYEAIWFQNSTGSAFADLYDFYAIGNIIDGSSLGTGSHTSGITFWGGNSTHRVNRCKAIGNTVLLPSAQTYGASGGIGVINGNDYTVDDNVVVGSNIGISCSNTSMGAVGENVVRGASIYCLEFAVSTDNCTATGNTLDGGNLALRGISASTTATALGLFNNKIRNLATASESSIFFAAATQVEIIGNTIRNTNNVAGRSGILFNGAVNTVTILGNTIDGGSGTTGVGVQWLGAATGLSITGNAFLNLTRANVLWGSASGATDFLAMAGNTQNNCTTVYLDAHSGSATFGANNQLTRMAPIYNAGTNTVSAGYATDTYLTGSNIALPTTGLAQKSMYRLRVNVSKTAAGTATPVVIVRVGSAGSTADTAVATLTFSAGTAVADTGIIEVYCTFRSIGATATMWVVGKIEHNGTAVGLVSQITDVRSTVASSFNSTTTGNILGVSVNGGTSAAWTTELVQAELVNLAVTG